VYVQDRLREMADTVWELLQDRATVFVCGSTRMADGVRGVLADLYQERTGSTAEAAEDWLRGLSEQHRYLVDVWASG